MLLGYLNGGANGSMLRVSSDTKLNATLKCSKMNFKFILAMKFVFKTKPEISFRPLRFDYNVNSIRLPRKGN